MTNFTAELLLVQVASTWCMVGVIWVVQLIVYPQFAQMERRGFAASHRFHSERITWIVGPVMVAEAGSAVGLWWVNRSPLATAGLVLVAVLWAATAFAIVPLHERLARGGFDAKAHAALVQRNWVRTVAWTARGVIAAMMLL